MNGWTEGGRIRGVCVCVTSKEREIGRASNKRVSKRETRDEEEGERERGKGELFIHRDRHNHYYDKLLFRRKKEREREQCRARATRPLALIQPQRKKERSQAIEKMKPAAAGGDVCVCMFAVIKIAGHK